MYVRVRYSEYHISQNSYWIIEHKYVYILISTQKLSNTLILFYKKHIM